MMSTELIMSISYILVGIILLFFAFWKFWFLRDPERNVPDGKNLIISPADGKVNEIIIADKEVSEIRKGRLGKIDVVAHDVAPRYKLVSIMMSPLDVHVQRAPIQGHLEKTRYKRGRFSNAMKGGMAIDNERMEYLINGDIKIKVIQIAGALAKRIVPYVRKGTFLKAGQRIGIINLGSQVSLIMPVDVELDVELGQRVTAGETIIGRYKVSSVSNKKVSKKKSVKKK